MRNYTDARKIRTENQDLRVQLVVKQKEIDSIEKVKLVKGKLATSVEKCDHMQKMYNLKCTELDEKIAVCLSLKD